MAGIKVKQHKIFKIGTTHLKKNKWNLKLTDKEAFSLDEEIKLFDSKLFRIAKKIIDEDNELVSWVDIDFEKYRKANDLITMRINVSVPKYLKVLGDEAGINFSQTLQKALKQIQKL